MDSNAGNFLVQLIDVRLSHFYGFRPYKGTNDDGKTTENYRTHAIMAPNHPGIALIKEAQRKAAAFAWKDQATQVLTALAGQDKLCLHDGNISQPGQDGYKDMLYVAANSKRKPKIVVTRGGQNVEIQENDPFAPYSGCRANVLVMVWPQYKGNFGKRINAQLAGVQFVAHGDRFGGGYVAKPEEFGLVATDADAAVPGGIVGAGADAAASSLI